MVGAAMTRRKRPAATVNSETECLLCSLRFAENPTVSFEHHGARDLPRFACVCRCGDTGDGVAVLCRCCARDVLCFRMDLELQR